MPECCPDNSETLSGCYRKQCPDVTGICMFLFFIIFTPAATAIATFLFSVIRMYYYMDYVTT